MFSEMHIIPDRMDFVPSPEKIEKLIHFLLDPRPSWLSVYPTRWIFPRQRSKPKLEVREPSLDAVFRAFHDHQDSAVHTMFGSSPWINQNKRISALEDADCCLWTPAIETGRSNHRDLTADGRKYKPSFRLTFCGDGWPVDWLQFTDRFRKSDVFAEIKDFLTPLTNVGWQAILDADV